MMDCIKAITTLNRVASEVMAEFEIHAATDITGFGLAGHALEMARGSGVRMEFVMDRLPIMQESLEMYRIGVTTGVNKHNRELVENVTRFENNLPSWHREIVYDPQTSGGLLASLPHSQGEDLVKALRRAGVDEACLVGKVEPLQDSYHLLFK
jgi:selenide,water dikinase